MKLTYPWMYASTCSITRYDETRVPAAQSPVKCTAPPVGCRIHLKPCSVFVSRFWVAYQPVPSTSRVPELALALLMLRILADNKNSAFSFNDFALIANRFY